MPVLTVPKNLRTQLGDNGSDELVVFINEALNEQKDNIIEIVEERFEAKLANLRADLIKWMFIFWSGQIVVITAIMFAFLKR